MHFGKRKKKSAKHDDREIIIVIKDEKVFFWTGISVGVCLAASVSVEEVYSSLYLFPSHSASLSARLSGDVRTMIRS